MQNKSDKETRFLRMLDDNKAIIAKVCYIYASPHALFDDLYQETVANLWCGFDKFRGEAKVSTWVYRAAINTCITWVSRNKRYADTVGLENINVIADELVRMARYRYLHSLIARLLPMEKAIVTLWLDDKSYDEIATITGISRANVAVKLHRIKDKMYKIAKSHPDIDYD